MSSSPGRKVVITVRSFDADALDWLRGQDCAVEITDLPPGKTDGDLDQGELCRLLAGAVGWIVGHARVTGALLDALPELRVISRRGVGYERVDIEAARALGRVVAIAAGGNDASVADHAVGLMIAVGRRFRELQDNMAKGDWTILTGGDLCGKTVGLIGLGRIGRSVVRRLSGFDARILVHTPHPDEAYARATGVTYTSLADLLAASDYVSLHAPLTPATRFLIDATAIAAMKPGAILINTARGGLVEDAHLLAALRSGHLGGAGLDVFASESDRAYWSVSQGLLAHPRVVATPHAGASTREGLARTNRIAAELVVAVLNGGDPAPGRCVADGRRTTNQR
ncbi:phosphoglycerate dehydrogenase [Nitrospirillum sp. BR 11163]|uniref:phosphoglycerate dehydrogenase n=1 Tax=Nitrospirillum sp. BR 11163 TaxID=3104323 RepID=UPI002AFF8465|nr:phosphoglycerate dehydrogenase [Nitrospirillum sp. BR 11163]MEA1676296.1 phosphoglycerate dehydrogenase [Nitrospirillum sp. BR 11163]